MENPDDLTQLIKENQRILSDPRLVDVLTKNQNFWRRFVFKTLPQGHGSGLDADTVDGMHASDFLQRIAMSNRVGVAVGGSGSGATKFTELTDVPNSYLGQSGKFPKVKATEDGLEFAAGGGGSGGSGGASAFTDLSDVPSSYTGQANKYPCVKVGEDGLEFVAGTGGVTNFVDLADVPSSYSGQGGKVVKVKSTADGLEFGNGSRVIFQMNAPIVQYDYYNEGTNPQTEWAPLWDLTSGTNYSGGIIALTDLAPSSDNLKVRLMLDADSYYLTDPNQFGVASPSGTIVTLTLTEIVGEMIYDSGWVTPDNTITDAMSVWFVYKTIDPGETGYIHIYGATFMVAIF